MPSYIYKAKKDAANANMSNSVGVSLRFPSIASFGSVAIFSYAIIYL